MHSKVHSLPEVTLKLLWGSQKVHSSKNEIQNTQNKNKAIKKFREQTPSYVQRNENQTSMLWLIYGMLEDNGLKGPKFWDKIDFLPRKTSNKVWAQNKDIFT